MVPAISIVVTAALAFQTTPAAAQGLRVADTQASPASPAAAAPQPEVTPELRGDIMMARKMFREALDYYKQGADKNPVLANKTGIAYHQMLDLPNAKKWYEHSIKLNPKYAEAINNLGTVYYAQKSYRRAIAQYRKALTHTPESASILSNLGTAFFARKQYDLAKKAVPRLLRME